MSGGEGRIWKQVQTHLANATEHVQLIAPFIKLDVFQAALAEVPETVRRIDCVTRWSVAEVAAGVSDPEIMQIAKADQRVHVRLCHNLHAKLFLADTTGLVGSANLTKRAMGTVPQHNIELLVETDLDHPAIQHLLQRIDETAVLATEEIAATIREQANTLNQTNGTIIVAGENLPGATIWYPATRRPDRLYVAYRGRADVPPAVREGLSRDLAFLDVPPGLDETDFKEAVRERLSEIPEVSRLLSGERLNNLDIQASVAGRAATSDREARRITETLAEWLKYFDRFYMDVATWELRPGQDLH